MNSQSGTFSTPARTRVEEHSVQRKRPIEHKGRGHSGNSLELIAHPSDSSVRWS